MFVIWKRRPIVSPKPEGWLYEWRSGVYRLKGVRCPHAADGERRSLIPLLERSRRVDGRSRREYVDRLPSIRSCCVGDPTIRAAWWEAVEAKLQDMADRVGGSGFDKTAIMCRLAMVVPAQTETLRALAEATVKLQAATKEVKRQRAEAMAKLATKRQEEADAEMKKFEAMRKPRDTAAPPAIGTSGP